MGGPKWIKPQHGPKLEHQKKQRTQPDKRMKLKKNLGLPQFGKYEPERFKRRRLGLTTAVNTGKPSTAAVASLKLAAAKAEEDFQRKQELTASKDDGFTIQISKGRGKDSTYRTYYKEFRKVVEASDVLLEVLDARDPIGCRCFDIERSIASEFNGKKSILLVLNKVDLIPREIAERWLAELREDMPVVAFTSMKGTVTNKCIDCLQKLLNAYSRTEEGGKKRITVGVIGFPNVGKSSIINALKRDTVVGVGNTPGFTKHSSEVQLSSNVTIMDCPGIIFSTSDSDSNSSVLRNVIKIETIKDPIAPVELILERCDKTKLREVFGLPDFKDATDFLTKIALKKGKVGKRCEPMLDEAAKIVLKDWNDGAIPFYTVPVRSSGFQINEDTVPTEYQRQYESIVVQGLPSLDDVKNCFAINVPQVKYETAAITPRRKKQKTGMKRIRTDDGSSTVATEQRSDIASEDEDYSDYDEGYMQQYMRRDSEDEEEVGAEDEEEVEDDEGVEEEGNVERKAGAEKGADAEAEADMRKEADLARELDMEVKTSIDEGMGVDRETVTEGKVGGDTEMGAEGNMGADSEMGAEGKVCVDEEMVVEGGVGMQAEMAVADTKQPAASTPSAQVVDLPDFEEDMAANVPSEIIT